MSVNPATSTPGVGSVPANLQANRNDRRFPGYDRLAEIMGGPESKYAIFRRFGALNMLNLMSLQAELVILEDDLRIIISSNQPNEEQRLLNQSFVLLHASKKPNHHQREKLEEIRKKLKEYNEALLQVAELRKLPQPEENSLQNLNVYLINPKGGDNFLMNGEEIEARTWETTYDLVAIPDFSEKDLFSSLLNTKVMRLYHKLWGSKHHNLEQNVDLESGTVQYSRTPLRRIAQAAVTIASSILPAICIIVLYFLNTAPARLGVMAAFTVLFSIAVSIFTSASPAEVFATTAAFAAVEVVFIGSSLKGGS